MATKTKTENPTENREDSENTPENAENSTSENSVAENSQTEENQDNDETPVAPRSEPVDVGPDAGGNSVLAAWRGLFHLFGARKERVDVTPEGIYVIGLTFDGQYPADMIISDLFRRGDKTVERRLDLIPTYFWANGEDPEPFTSADEMTAWMVQYFKGAGDGDGSRSPEYVKKAIASYKDQHGIAAPRGRRRKIVRLDHLDEIRPEALVGVNLGELQKLQATILRAMELAAEQNSQSSTEAAVAVSA